MKISGVVKDMRRRLGKSQAKFAAVLQCSQNSVSYYESGEVEPGLGILMRLYDIGDQRERDVIAPYIKKALGSRYKGLAGEPHINADDSVESLRGIIQDAALEDVLLKEVTPEHRAVWHSFLEVVIRLIQTDREIDESVVELLRLFEKHYKDPTLRPSLRDALGYLQVRLTEARG